MPPPPSFVHLLTYLLHFTSNDGGCSSTRYFFRGHLELKTTEKLDIRGARDWLGNPSAA